MPDFEAMAMIELEKMYPAKIVRLDYLTDRERDGTISVLEAHELDLLDCELLMEFDRIKFHWQLNWSCLSQDRKDVWIERVKERKSRRST